MHPDVISTEIDCKGEHYVVEIRHVDLLRPEDRARLRLEQASFVVHLFQPGGFKTFELYIGDQYLWETTAGTDVDPELIGKLGELVETKWDW